VLKIVLFLITVGFTSLPLLLGRLKSRGGRGTPFEPAAAPPPAWQIALAVSGVFLYVAAVALANFYTEILWWRDDLKQPTVFWKLFSSRWGWGAVFGFIALVFIGLNILFVRMKTAADAGSGPGRKLARGVALAALFLAFQHGMSLGRDHWREILLWKNRESFGVAEPIFNKDVGFYMFSYPFLHLVTDWFLGLVALTLAGVVVLYLLRAAGRLGIQPGPRGQIQFYLREETVAPGWNRLLTHASLLGALLLLGFVAKSRLAIWGLMYSSRGVVYGPGYTDVHVMIPALNAVSIALVLGSVLLLVAVGARSLKATVRALRAGVSIVVVVWLLGVVITPALIQRYQVSPNETSLEIPYIRHNMKFTRLGFGLMEDRIELRDFPPVQPVSRANLVNDTVTISNVRLWDWRALESTYDQNQSFRQYYDFFDVDIDRYSVNGRVRQVMLALRELNPRSFSENAATWVNMRLIYTHGYGLCMNPTNEFNPEGLPNYWIKDIPPVAVDSTLAVHRPEIYFGEMTHDPVYVESAQKEFNYPRGDENVYTRYSGLGGVPLGGGLRRLALALRFDGLRQITSADLHADTRLLFRREIRERLQEATPFLRFDHDPYAVVADGRLYIVVDAYTTSEYFPYSEKLPGGLNYIRNSVKATVDCYDGTVRYYVFDESDPLIRAWSRIFPGLLRPASEMSQALRAHVRYPEDFLSIQAHVYSTYHMTDPLVFYNKEDRWAIAKETAGQGEPREMLPYYAVLELPGEPREEFVQLIPFTPFSVNQPRNNMVGWMAGRCDGPAYGKLLVYRFPKQTLVYGPMQIEARIDQDANISKDLTLWNQQGSSVIRGNLIVLPLENTILYTEPIFLQATHSRMPELKRVVVASQDRLGYGETFDQALSNLVRGTGPEERSDLFGRVEGAGGAGADSLGAFRDSTRAAGGDWRRARELYRRYLELSGAGRLEEAGRELEELGRTLGAGENRRQ
jgi:uncharacterized membrane protein (UPF0182 family)